MTCHRLEHTVQEIDGDGVVINENVFTSPHLSVALDVATQANEQKPSWKCRRGHYYIVTSDARLRGGES